MKYITKLSLSLLSLMLLACQPNTSVDQPTLTPKSKPKPNSSLDPAQRMQFIDGAYNVAFLIMEGVYNTELTAPFDIFQHTRFREGIRPMNVFMVADTKEAITSFEGMRILPDYNYLTDNLPQIDILVIPSAEHHLDTDLENERMIQFVKDVDQNATFMTSHCDGAFVLAKAGLLDDVVSTTFPSDIDKMRDMFPQLEIRKDLLFVHDGKYITSAGGAKSFEAALYLCEHLYGDSIARSLAGGLVIDWNLGKVPHLVVSDDE